MGYFDLNNSVDEKRSDRRGKKKKHKEKSKKRSKHIEENGIVPNDRENLNDLPVFVNRAAEMPDGANETDGDEEEDRKIDVNGILTENENIKRSKEKKKKHKDDEKSKKKKRKKVDDYAVCSADDEKHPNSSNNINLWLEDV